MEAYETSQPLVEPDDCSLVRALSVVGERWTMLLLRQAFYGVRRFDDMQAQLGTSRKVLSERLARMVAAGVIARVPYRDGEQRTRHEYKLTEKGEGLATVLIALMQWGDQHMPHPDGRPLRIVDRDTGQEVRAVLVRDDGHPVDGLAAIRGQPWPDRACPRR
jgi:DNA-binding HxlR family transcriptional regulator